jgi:hypothetical protein
MTSNELTPQVKKLSTLRRLLWIVFGAVSIPLALLWVPLLILMGNLEAVGIAPPPGISSGLLLYLTGGFLFVLIGITGAICLLIYNIFKYRLEKDEDLFL